MSSGFVPHSLDRLPPEIISQIVSYAPTARYLRDLSLTCRIVHDIVESDGWSSLVLNRFPSFRTPPCWRNAAHSLSTLSRSFDRKAFIAQNAGPDFGPNHTRIHALPSGEIHVQWTRPKGQTMGYQPVIDSHEVFLANTWTSRKEVVAWGAGAEIVVKFEDRGPHVREEQKKAEKDGQGRSLDSVYDQTGHLKQTWLTYHHPHYREGINDVTALKILKPSTLEDKVNLIVGHASGELQHVQLSKKTSTIMKHFDSGRSPVRCADITQSTNPLVAACLGDSQVALFQVNGREYKKISEITCPSEDRGVRSWSSVFIGPNRLAIGRGISKRILEVYSLDPDGISKDPVRTFSSDIGREMIPITSCYPIVSVPRSSHVQDYDGEIFFSGGYDGIIR